MWKHWLCRFKFLKPMIPFNNVGLQFGKGRLWWWISKEECLYLVYNFPNVCNGNLCLTRRIRTIIKVIIRFEYIFQCKIQCNVKSDITSLICIYSFIKFIDKVSGTMFLVAELQVNMAVPCVFLIPDWGSK